MTAKLHVWVDAPGNPLRAVPGPGQQAGCGGRRLKCYYIVVATPGPPNSASLRQTLARVQRAYPAAYAKRTAAWRSYMH